MPRTNFPRGYFKGQPMALNISPFLVNISYLIRTTPITKARQVLDRINFVVRNRRKNLKLIKQSLASRFRAGGSHMEDQTRVFEFFHEVRDRTDRIQLWFKPRSYWLELLVTGDSLGFWEVQAILAEVLPAETLLSQLEFALDIFPANPDDVNTLHMRSRHIVMKNGRGTFFRDDHYPTFYFGRAGQARKGPKGFCIYKKEEPKGVHFLRVELRANRNLIKQMGWTIHDLPLSPWAVMASNYFELRKGLSPEGLDALALQVLRKRSRSQYRLIMKPDRARRASDLDAARGRLDLIRRRLEQRILREAETPELGWMPSKSNHGSLLNPVPLQIINYRKEAARFGLSPRVDRFFPLFDGTTST